MSARVRKFATPEPVEAIRFVKPYTDIKKFDPRIRFQYGGMYGRLVRSAIVPGDHCRAELGDWIIRRPSGNCQVLSKVSFDMAFRKEDQL